MTQGEMDRVLESTYTPEGRRAWVTGDGRFTVRDHPFEFGLLIQPEDWSFAIVRPVLTAGLSFHVRNVTEARERLVDIYQALGWDSDLRTS